MDRSIKAGIYGFILAVVINLFSPTNLDFVPFFVAALIVIFVFSVDTLKEGLVASLMTYFFSYMTLQTVVAAIYYYSNEPYPAFTFDVYSVLSPVVLAVTAVIAAYVGVWLAKKRKPQQQTTLPIIQPPSLPT